MQRVTLCLTILCVSGFLLSGCGRGGGTLGRVSGTVRYQGEPIREGSIVFEVAGQRSASGKIVDGQITDVTTFEPDDGVPIGLAKIAVHAFAGPDTASAVMDHPGDVASQDMQGYMDVPESLLPERYADPATSGLTFEIQRGDNDVSLDLTP